MSRPETPASTSQPKASRRQHEMQDGMLPCSISLHRQYTLTEMPNRLLPQIAQRPTDWTGGALSYNRLTRRQSLELESCRYRPRKARSPDVTKGKTPVALLRSLRWMEFFRETLVPKTTQPRFIDFCLAYVSSAARFGGGISWRSSSEVVSSERA